MLNKIKPYIAAATIGLTGILAGNAKAEEPQKTTIEQPAPRLLPSTTEQEIQPKRRTFLGQPITERQIENLKMLPALPEVYLSYLFIEPLIHESGHAALGSAFGLKIEEFHPYPGSGQRAYVRFDKEDYLDLNDKSKAKLAAVNGAGIVFSRTAAEGLDALMNRNEMNPFVEQAMAAVYFPCRIEFLKYALISAASNWGKTGPWTGDDVHNLIRFVTKDPAKQKWVYAGLGAALIADLVLDKDELKDNWYRLWMKQPKDDSKADDKQYGAMLLSSDRGLEVLLTYKF